MFDLSVPLPHMRPADLDRGAWKALPEDQRQAAATAAHVAWKTYAGTLRYLARQTRHAGGIVGEILLDAEYADEYELRGLIKEAVPGWPVPADEAEAHQIVALLGDMTEGFDRRAAEADDQATDWAHRAGIEIYQGEAGML